MALNQSANVWIVITDTVHEQIKDRIGDPDYDGQLINAVRMIRRQADTIGSSRAFKRPTIAGKERRLFSVNFDQGEDGAAIQDAIDLLDTELGTDFSVAGAWWWDGRQVGTQWVDPTDQSLGTTGTPLYPINETQLVKFMPDVVVDATDPDNPVYGPATQLTDVNVTAGQAERRFS